MTDAYVRGSWSASSLACAVLPCTVMMLSARIQATGSSSTQQTLLIATADETQRSYLAAQLDADGYTIYEADSVMATVTRLSGHAIDVLILGDLDRPADGLRLLRAIRADEHPRIHPSQARGHARRRRRARCPAGL